MDPLLSVSDEVRAALADGRPVVALESSLITTGPYPAFVEVALTMEKMVREAGAVPATIGVVDGRFLVGLDPATIERFGEDKSIPKLSARDLGPALARGGLGATTVAGTIVIAERAGIETFCTAGIGGVHRRGQDTFDISADLLQFRRTRITVVCSGAKSILDHHLTAEYLETAGIPIFGYRTDTLPAFYVRDSDIPVDRVDELAVAARAVRNHWAVNGGGTVLLTTPIDEQDGLDHDVVEAAIAEALTKADEAGVTGNAISPFLMKSLAAATAGATAAAGRAVLVSGARVAGDFAVQLAAVGPVGPVGSVATAGDRAEVPA